MGNEIDFNVFFFHMLLFYNELLLTELECLLLVILLLRY
jgi:hypothetical protein